MTTNNEILEKIARLLTLAEGNANEHEASAAMAAASRLMEKHKIDRATVDALDLSPEEPIDVGIHAIVDESMGKQATNWRWYLLNGIARVHGCRAYYAKVAASLDHPARAEWRVIGTTLDAGAVRYLYAFAARQIDGFARRAMDNGMGSGKTWGQNFRQAAALRVAERYAEAFKKNASEARAHAPGAALIRVDDRAEAVALAVREHTNRLHLRAGSARTGRYDSSAQAAGREAGDRVDLGNGTARGSLGSGPRASLR